MTFLHFSLLAGGSALVVVPVVLHLLLRGKPRPLEFPALRFVQSRRRLNQRRFRLKHLLLLALRMLLIALLGLLLARPSIKLSGGLGSQEAPVAAALVFDTAPRMLYTQSNRTRLEVATELGEWIIRQLPKESRVAVVDGRRIPATFQVDIKAAEQRMERLDATSSGRSLSQSVAAALEVLQESERTRHEMYILTDMAASAWTNDVAAMIQERSAQLSDLGVYVVDVGAREPINTGVERLRLSKQVIAGRAPLSIQAELAHWGPPAERVVELWLESRGEEPTSAESLGEGERRGRRELSFDDGTPRRGVAFELSRLDPGLHQGELRLTGQDGLAVDDIRYFTFEVRPPWTVLLVAPEPAKVTANYMKQALAPTLYEEVGRAPFECTVVSQKEFTAALDQNRLGAYAAILLLDPGPLAPAQWERLGQWVSTGGGLGLFLGRNAGRRTADMESFNTAAAQTLLPAPLVRQARAPEEGVHLAPLSYEDPILATFHELDESIPWAASPVFRYWELGKLRGGSRVAVPYVDGRPAVVTRAVGQGRVVTMTTPVSDAPAGKPWNLLPVTEAAWTFVALADGMARYLVGAGQDDFNYVAGQTAVLHLSSEQQGGTHVLRKADGVDVRVAADPQDRSIRVTSTDAVGNYTLRSRGRSGRRRLGFSVNYAPSQIDLSRVSDKQLENIFGETPFRLAADRAEIEVGISRGRVGRELFPVLMVLLVLCLAAELWLSNRFYKQ